MEEKVSMETTRKTANRGSLKSRGKRPLMDVIGQKYHGWKTGLS